MRGRSALVTFAFGNCESICPLIVRQALDAQARQRTAEDGFLLSGEVDAVNRS